MRLKSSNAGVLVCALLSVVVLSAVAAFMAAPALALPEGRVYEMVSPVYKGGYGVNQIVAVAPDGESIAFVSLGAFEGDPANNAITNDYVARRGASSWSTAPLVLPATIAPRGGLADFSPSLESSLIGGTLGSNAGGAGYEGTEFEYLLHRTDLPDTAPNALNPAPNFELAGMVLKDLNKTHFTLSYESASLDLSHIVFIDTGLPLEQLLPEAAKTQSHLYDLARSLPCGKLSKAVCSQNLGAGVAAGEPSLRLVGLNNQGGVVNPSCQTELGAKFGRGSQFNDVSADGSESFFTTGVSSGCEPNQLFVRVGGSRTLEVSKPLPPLAPVCLEVPCSGAAERKPAEFRGASEDGSKVFFSTTQSLVSEDSDTGNDLYMARIGCAGGEAECEPSRREVTALVQVSHAKEPAEVKDVVAVAPDGSRVYFVARGMLSEGPNAEGQMPLKGADNLYVYDSTTGKPPVFIADLCSGPELSGEEEDIHCPADLAEGESAFARNDTALWVTSEPQAQVNECSRPIASECAGGREPGRYLVFSSYGQLTAGDTDAARDVYRYDAATGMLERVSVGEAGFDANGNASAFAATITPNREHGQLSAQHDLNSRAISEDGSRIVFMTAEPLSPTAVKGLTNAYEWHEGGGVSLVSTGGSSQPVDEVVISSSGRDVFFTTTQGLLPQDTDGVADIYDARLGGGFPAAPAPRQPCSGDACQGPLTNPAPLLVPGSVPQAPGGNFAAANKATTKKLTPAQQLARALKACAKKPKSRRAACRRAAQKKYAKAARSAVRRGR
jgi:hypothetical protein